LINGEEKDSDEEKTMPRKPYKKTPNIAIFLLTMAVYLLVLLLILKGFGLLQLWFKIDSNGVTVSFDVGYLTSAGLFIYVLTRLHKIDDKVSALGERVASTEGKLEEIKKK